MRRVYLKIEFVKNGFLKDREERTMSVRGDKGSHYYRQRQRRLRDRQRRAIIGAAGAVLVVSLSIFGISRIVQAGKRDKGSTAVASTESNEKLKGSCKINDVDISGMTKEAARKAVLEKYNKKLADARIEAAEIREAAQEKGKQIEAEMKAKATEESARIIENGEKHLAAQRELVVAELRREMGQNAISLAEALVGEQLSENVKRSGSIDRFLDDLDSISAKSAGK